MDSPAPSLPSTVASLVRKRTDAELMPPPPPAKKIKRPKTVLDEDSYTDGLSRIIARDFFPGLQVVDAQQSYLDALDSKDKTLISTAARRLQDVMTPSRRFGETPGRADSATPLRTATPSLIGPTPVGLGAATPASTSKTTATPRDGQAIQASLVDTNMSLTAFQSAHTSEDNESFYRVLDRQNQKRVEKYAWAWNANKLPSKQMIAQRKVEEKLARSRSLVDDGFKKDRLAIRDQDERPAQINTRKSCAKNSLMFIPDGVDGLMETPAQTAAADSRMGPKAIMYDNTRMPQPISAGTHTRPNSPTLSAVRDAIRGVPREADRDSTMGAPDTPRVNGYAFVDDAEEQDEDGGDEDDEDVPEIDLGPGDATPNPFRIPEARRREALLHKMVDRLSESKKTASRSGTAAGAARASPRQVLPRTPGLSGALTPAAQRLWSTLGGSATPAPVPVPVRKPYRHRPYAQAPVLGSRWRRREAMWRSR